MGVNPDIAGRAYPPARLYEVGREKIAEFAAATGSSDPAHFDPEAAPERDGLGIGPRQRVSRCVVCLPQFGQNFARSSRSGSFRRFFFVM